MGLGSYPAVRLKDARQNALEARQLLESGKDPLSVRRELLEAERHKRSSPAFAEAARKVHEDLKSGFRNEKHASQ